MPKFQLHLQKISLFREIDYVLLKNVLCEYAHPRTKIQQLLAKGALIRVKKGLYVLGKDYTNSLFSLTILANLIYGPSAISLEYALSYYGLIPERVYAMTSITPQRDKTFDTPVGRFTYRYLTMKKYTIGLTRLRLNDSRYIIIASPEKALLDKIYFSKPIVIQNNQDAENFLFEDLRIDENALETFDINLLTEIAMIYKNASVTAVSNYLKQR